MKQIALNHTSGAVVAPVTWGRRSCQPLKTDVWGDVSTEEGWGTMRDGGGGGWGEGVRTSLQTDSVWEERRLGERERGRKKAENKKH